MARHGDEQRVRRPAGERERRIPVRSVGKARAVDAARALGGRLRPQRHDHVGDVRPHGERELVGRRFALGRDDQELDLVARGRAGAARDRRPVGRGGGDRDAQREGGEEPHRRRSARKSMKTRTLAERCLRLG